MSHVLVLDCKPSNPNFKTHSYIDSCSPLQALQSGTRFCKFMGTSWCRKLTSNTNPRWFSPLSSNFSLRPFATKRMYHNAILSGFLKSWQNLDLVRVSNIIGIYEFVDIQWDCVETGTVVDIHQFGISGYLIQRTFFRRIFGIFVLLLVWIPCK